MSTVRQSREAALEATAAAAGETWALDWTVALRKDGRVVSGGWPGTMSEARMRIAACVASQPPTNGPLAPTVLEGLAKIAYAAAKKTWLARANVDNDV